MWLAVEGGITDLSHSRMMIVFDARHAVWLYDVPPFGPTSASSQVGWSSQKLEGSTRQSVEDTLPYNSCSTISAMARQLVRPGLSIPSKLTQPS